MNSAKKINNRAVMTLWWVFLISMAVSTLSYAKVRQNVEKMASATALDTSRVELSGAVDPGKVSFAMGEEMRFVISVDFDGQSSGQPYYFKWVRTGDDGKIEKGESEIVSESAVTIKTAMINPGFVRITGTVVDRHGQALMKEIQEWGNKVKKPISFNGGAGVDIDKLVQAMPEPTDFDTYWDQQKKRLNAVPVKYRMERVNNSGEKVGIYAVSIDCAGSRPVTGYLTVPVVAGEKSLPAMVCYQGYGTSIQRPPSAGAPSMIQFTINAHGFDLGKDSEYYEEFFENIKSNGKSYAFDPAQNSNPKTAYFDGIALRVMRSLQFVKSLSQWNGELTVTGGSQGGLQTMWAAGLDHDVTMAELSIPWCCDLGGSTVGRLRGWVPEWDSVLGYFDAVNHAKRVKCPVIITRVGLGDYTCPPSGITILYNAIKTSKKIHYVQGSTHGFIPAKPQTMVMKEN